MPLSPRKDGLDCLFKEVRAFKERPQHVELPAKVCLSTA